LATDARAALGDALIHEGERYRLDRAKVRIDLDRLDQLLANTDADNEPDLEAALALWRGEPLEGADYIWAEGDIHRLRATLLGLLERAGHARLERGDARGACTWQSRPSRSTSSTRRLGGWRYKPNTRSGCASRSPAATRTSPKPSTSSSGSSPRGRRESCTGSYWGKADPMLVSDLVLPIEIPLLHGRVRA
jgi:hypothetical protein